MSVSRSISALGVCALLAASGCGPAVPATEPVAIRPTSMQEPPAKPGDDEPAALPTDVAPPARLSAWVVKGIGWLAEAQHENGGWGAGSHANQQQRDPHGVDVDPATTAFAAMTLVRLGNTPVSGDYRETVRRATEYLLASVEAADSQGPAITSLTGTQPQAKLGQYVDTSMTAQFLARVRSTLPEDSSLHKRVDVALDKCLAKLKSVQNKDGSWAGGGWAGVLQSSLSCTAFELAEATGKKIDGDVLVRARKYQKQNVDEAGRANADAAAGVELYSFSGSQRANAADARAATELIDRAKREGKLEQEAPVNARNLEKAGAPALRAATLAGAAQQNQAQLARLKDETLLAGFGNNGGEEFLSYLLTSESLILAGGGKWKEWNDEMHRRLEKIQNSDGSWSGHHCITSPVFCTAAAIQCLTTDHDAELLLKIARAATKEDRP